MLHKLKVFINKYETVVQSIPLISHILIKHTLLSPNILLKFTQKLFPFLMKNILRCLCQITLLILSYRFRCCNFNLHTLFFKWIISLRIFVLLNIIGTILSRIISFWFVKVVAELVFGAVQFMVEIVDLTSIVFLQSLNLLLKLFNFHFMTLF